MSEIVCVRLFVRVCVLVFALVVRCEQCVCVQCFRREPEKREKEG